MSESESSMAAILLAVEEYFRNGPTIVGISAGSDEITSVSDKLVLRDSLSEFVGVNVCGASDNIREIVCMGLAWLHADQRRIDLSKATRETHKTAQPYNLNIAQADRAVSLIFASKINFWATNHHTGQGKVSGFFKKMCHVFEINTNEKEDIHALWKMAHWASTKEILRHLKVIPGKATASLPAVSEDIAIRLSSHPAGTAIYFVTHIACTRVANSIYAYFCPLSVKTEYAELCEAVKRIKASPASYHIGAKYLTGREREQLPDIGSNVSAVARGWLDVVDKNSSLSNAPTKNRLEADESINQIFRSIRKTLVDTQVVSSEIIQEKLGIRVGDNPFK